MLSVGNGRNADNGGRLVRRNHDRDVRASARIPRNEVIITKTDWRLRAFLVATWSSEITFFLAPPTTGTVKDFLLVVAAGTRIGAAIEAVARAIVADAEVD